PDDPSPVDEGASTPADDAKQFGFAHRDEQDWNEDTIELEAGQELPPMMQDDQHRGQAAAGAMGGPWPDEEPRSPPSAPVQRRPAAAAAAPRQPVVSTPHIERLREQIGAEAAEAIEPWISDEPEAPPVPNATQPLPMIDSSGSDEIIDTDLPSEQAPDTAPPRPSRGDPVDARDQAAPEPVRHEADDVDPIEDVAVTIGRIVSIKGSVIWGALFDDIGGHAARAARMGALVSMRGPESRVFGIVNRLSREQQIGSAQSERTIFEVQVLGEIADDRTGFQRGVSSYPPLDSPVTTITIRDIATIYARPRTSNVHIGQLRHNPKVPAFVLTDSLLGKHFAVLGTTGTGKSCATTVILRSILDEHPQGHVVLIDPHNEYGPAFSDRAELLNPGNLQLPYWLLNFEEIAHVVLNGASREQLHSQGALLKNAIIQAKNQFAGGDHDENLITVDTPVPYRLSDLVSVLKESMGTFNKAEGASLYLSLINRIESLRADRRFAFMFSSLAVRDNMEQVLAQLLRIPTEGKPITIIDISGLPSDVVDVVVSVLFRLTFELAVWSERGKAPPVLLVCEEAHRYVPEQSDIGFAPTKRVIAQIAKEGRKYGVTLCLVSQRPSELAVSSLAQCNTIFALRMSNEHDQAFVSQTLSENARWLVDSLPSLNTQEAVVVGDGVTVPVHIRFKDLPRDHRPASHDPSFAKSWCQEADPSFVASAIDRWRRQAR
ncbi:MAG: DUF87 domain-containing protein, partial [Alphaproteobacteria bacterium]|nr:DUF87 domain-containing protein [Alphaproteobacteria bacterium]